MSNLQRFTNNFKFCYPIMEKNKNKFFNKAIHIAKFSDCLIELRVDYLLSSGLNLDKILCIIDEINNYICTDRLILTIRTIKEGGQISLSNNEYYNYFEKIFRYAKVKYIDVEYEYYIKDIKKYKSLFCGKLKQIIMSKHVFNGAFKCNEYENIFIDMSKNDCDIVKFAIMLNTKEELFEFMMLARKYSILIKNKGKNCIFIAMGKIGQLSRLWPEFTNTCIVFLAENGKNNSMIGQLSYENYVKYRKLLEKINKN